MLRLFQSNKMENLVDALVGVLRESTDPFAREWIAVRGTGMRGWLSSQLARRLGIWASGRPMFPRDLIGDLMAISLGPDNPNVAPFDRDNLTWSVYGALPALENDRQFAQVRAYLRDDDRGVKRYQLASAVAHVFDEYALYRPDVVLSWEQGGGEGWQPVLWREIARRHPGGHFAQGHRLFTERARHGGIAPKGLPRRISVFGLSTLPPAHMDVLINLPEAVSVNLFVLTPTAEYWADVRKGGEKSFGIDSSLEYESNTLLASCGRLGRDFQEILLERAGERILDHRDDFADPGAGGTMLEVVQSDLLNLVARGGIGSEGTPERSPVQVDERDRSVVVNSCHSPMREIEVLKDQILDLLDDDDADFAPEDILVLALDIGRYAPLIEAVFARGSGPDIPFEIRGSGGRDGGVIEAIDAILSLPRGRMTLQEVFDVLMLEPVRRRFSLEIEDVEIAQQWMWEAGVRWGIDQAHRRSVDQPGSRENTWMFGLERLLLGYALPDDGNGLFGGVLPYDRIEGGQAQILGRFVDFVYKLIGHVQGLTRPRTWRDWRTSLDGLLRDLVLVGHANGTEHRAVEEALVRLLSASDMADLKEDIDLDVVRDSLSRILQQEGEMGHGRAGGVIFGDLTPMGGIPARAICLLGMNDADFPRFRRLPTFDLTSRQQRLGDRSVRNDDLYLFLEVILGARERLILSHVGQCNRSNRRFPPSVLVSELIDVIERSFISLRGPLRPEI